MNDSVVDINDTWNSHDDRNSELHDFSHLVFNLFAAGWLKEYGSLGKF